MLPLSVSGCCGAAGRDYVLRRVLRRGVRYGQDTLKAPAGFFHGLVDSVVASMGHFYPELVKARDHIVEVIRCAWFNCSSAFTNQCPSFALKTQAGITVCLSLGFACQSET